MESLITTILHRPYVFAFLAAYLFLGWRRWGIARTLTWLVTGYSIAWLSEIASITIHIPYGEYHYIYTNMPGELMILGVPFFDSLSYPFLVFAAFTTAEGIIGKWSRTAGFVSTLAIVALGALLTMLLDVIVDPIATMGNRWFLGQIHYYSFPGNYFGVPMTNFAGWFIVAFAIIGTNVALWRFIPPLANTSARIGSCIENALYPLFYVSIALFSISITFWIGEIRLGVSSLSILTLISFFIIRKHSALRS